MAANNTVTGSIKFQVEDTRLIISDDEFCLLREFIHLHTGIALSEHKRALVCSRLAKRLRFHGHRHYSEYYALLTQGDPEGHELVAMINCITTNKTDFFREQHHFQFLKEVLIPEYQRNQNRVRPMRIWSAASSTGEEAYSIAMTVLDAMLSCSELDVRILATDIDTDVISRAQNGIYTLEQTKQIPQILLHRYFLKGQGVHENYVMAKPALKKLIQFNWLNLLNEPWPMKERFDVIFCRNVLIYFDKPTQQKLFQRMGNALKKDGYLMLGHSEAMHGLIHKFKPVGHSIYQNLGEK